MRLIEQWHQIISIPENPLGTIEYCARNCYRSHDKMTEGSAPAMVKSLRDRGHHAMLEFGNVTVMFITNRGVMAEITRHRMASFAIQSTRYCNFGQEDIDFIRPCWWEDMTVQQRFLFSLACRESEHNYKELLKSGQRPEQAREVLNHALRTDIVMSANFREWRHIFKLRTDKTAHPMIRDLLSPLLSDMKQVIPVIFDDI